MSDERLAPGTIGPSSAPPAGAGLTRDPEEAPGGVAQGGPPADAAGEIERHPAPGFHLGGPGPAPLSPGLGPPPGMMINPDFMRWRQMAAAWQAERQRRELQFLSACNVIRRDASTGFKIDIEADSTVAADEQAEKMARTEFLQAIMPMLQMVVPEIQQNPAIAPLVKSLVMFGVRAFPAARSLEDSFEQAFAALAQMPPQPPAQKGNVKSPAEIAAEAATARGDQQVDMAKVQVEQQKNAVDMMKTGAQMRQDQQKMQFDNFFKTMQLAQQSQQMQSRSQIEAARLSAMLSRQTRGLV